MRRRAPRAGDPGTPPAALLTFVGKGWLAARDWLRAREAWWAEHHDEDDPRDLSWIIDGFAQTPNQPFCGSVSGVTCGEPGCACEHFV